LGRYVSLGRKGPLKWLSVYLPAPIAGALLAGVVFRALFEPDVQEPPVTGR